MDSLVSVDTLTTTIQAEMEITPFVTVARKD